MIRYPAYVKTIVMVIVCLLLSAGSTFAATESAGTVLAARGKVEAIDANASIRALKIKAEVFTSDTVQTGKAGRAQLMFKDNTIVSLGVNSVFKVDEYQWNGEQKSGVMKTSVEEGTFRVLGGLITKHSPKNFSTETPAATIGIRGSMYAGKATRGETIVVFLGGKGIVVYNPLGQIEITEPGYGVRVRLGEAPGDPQPFSMDELAQLLEGMGPAQGGQALVSDRTTDFDKATEGRLPFDPDGFRVPVNDLEQVVTDANQERLLNNLPSNTTENDLPPSTAEMTGKFMQVMTHFGYALSEVPINRFALVSDISGDIGPTLISSDRPIMGYDDRWALLDSAAFSNGGLITALLSDGDSVPSFLTQSYSPTVSYMGPSLSSDTVQIDSVWGQFSSTRLIFSEDRGEFFMTLEDEHPSLPDPDDFLINYGYSALHFAGMPTAASEMPLTGVDSYAGYSVARLLGYSEGDYNYSDVTTMSMAVNWENQKVIGRTFSAADSLNGSSYFYGELDGASLTNVQFIGDGFSGLDYPPYDIVSIDGTTTFGQFYGAEYQGFGLTAEGTQHPLYDQTLLAGDWSAAAASFRVPDTTQASLTGTATMDGTAVGIFQDMWDPSNYYMMSGSFGDMDDVHLVIDRDSGTINGSFDVTDNGLDLEAYPVVDNFSSAYIDDHTFIGSLYCGEGDCVDLWGGEVSYMLDDYGNYFVTAPAEDQFSDYLTWGYWGLAFDEVDTEYLLTQPGALWIAGEKTPAPVIENLYNYADGFVGEYQGPAYGVQIDRFGVTPLTGGSTTLYADFFEDNVYGDIVFDQHTIEFDGPMLEFDPDSSTSTYPMSFHASSAGMDAANWDTNVTGAFYGPQAEAVGGSFYSYENGEVADPRTFQGIFGGNLVNGPIPVTAPATAQ